MKKTYILKKIMCCISFILSVGYLLKYYKNRMDKLNSKNIDFHRMYMMTLQWAHNEHAGIEIAKWLADHNYNKVAIYGMNEIGIELVDMLKNSDINVAFGVDKSTKKTVEGLDICKPYEISEEVDLIIVAAFNYFDEIVDEISEIYRDKLMPIDEIIYQFKHY